MKSSPLFTPQKLQLLTAGDGKVLNEFDRQGLFPGADETAEEFAQRMQKLAAALNELRDNLKKTSDLEVDSGIRIGSKVEIPPSITNEALAETDQLYAVRPEWVPGFFANESFGFFWGGCSLSDPASGLSLFIIRKAFKKKTRWLVYSRKELLAHEMTHAAHQAFNEWQFEEYFAYRTAHSPFRRWLGSSFIHKFDAWGFLLPILLLPVVQFLNISGTMHLPVGYFWALAAVYPVFLICRTAWINSLAQRARNYLESQKVKQTDAILFRMSVDEIKMLARRQMPQGNDLRWQLLSQRLNARED
jgi:hypothetical protein